jgi:galactokinase
MSGPEVTPHQQEITAQLRNQFRERFGGTARVFRAPGRVNLIGEHTDYNDGFVMPAAIGFYTWIAIAPRADSRLVVHSTNFGETVEIRLNVDAAQQRNKWSDYVEGVSLMLRRAGLRLRGASLLIRGDVPIGSGLASSAAIEVATAIALSANSELSLDRVELAKLCCQAENEFVGAHVGIMDQFISCCGHAGQALMLDCRSLEYRLLPIPSTAALLISNTMVKHEHSSSEYNRRRAECEQGVRLLRQWFPNIYALRDVSLAQLESRRAELPDVIYRRCRHVVSENQRVMEAASALERGDLDTFGRLMAESHRSLRDDYQVSCSELDIMVHAAARQPGVYGARMTGGGFGGCTINLVRADAADRVRSAVASEYQTATGITPQLFVCTAAEGAGEVTE